MSTWNFDITSLEKVKSPLDVVNNLCEELRDISRGRVIARATEYNGNYKSTGISFHMLNTLTDSIIHVNNSSTFNVQDVMGDNAATDDCCNKFVYELFVTSRNTPKYKYRVFIMYYGINMYPVGLTIQEDIAKEIAFESEGMQFENEAAFTDALGKILGSATLGGVLRNLAALNS